MSTKTSTSVLILPHAATHKAPACTSQSNIETVEYSVLSSHSSPKNRQQTKTDLVSTPQNSEPTRPASDHNLPQNKTSIPAVSTPQPPASSDSTCSLQVPVTLKSPSHVDSQPDMRHAIRGHGTVSTTRTVSTSHNLDTVAMLPPPMIDRVQNLELNTEQSTAVDLQTAETLLQLREIMGSPEHNPANPTNALPYSILDTYENEEILPVNAAPMPDFSKDMGNEDKTQEANDSDNSSDTIVYDTQNNKNDKGKDVTLDHSPRGQIKFKHYGIRRNYSSPQSKGKKYKCLYCEVTRGSKREINDHHRKTHGQMTCVECSKTFPTPDALQRHLYIHFKRKSDLTSHAITHTGKPKHCPEPGCDYSNVNPRNLKQHMKVHSDTKPIKCPMCEKRFKHHQQLKRHREDHK